MPIQTVQIPTPDGPADALVAAPTGPGPGVLLYTDAFGLRPEIETKALELAGHGYSVLVPNVYHRHGPAPVVDLPAHIGEDVRPEIISRFLPLLGALSSEDVLRDADAYLGFLAERADVRPGPVAVIGYCIGAAFAMRTATARPDRVAALAGFHPGFLVTDAPDSPHRDLRRITARVHLGLADGDLTPDAVDEVDRALTDAGVEHGIEVYPDTVHGFTMTDTDAHHPAALRRHWDRLLALLDRALPTS